MSGVQKVSGNLVQKSYSLHEAFGPEFPASQKIFGFEPSACAFVPKRDPFWHWDREVLRDLMWWWQAGGSNGLYLFGPHGSGKSSAIRQFCAALHIPLYVKGIHEEVLFEDLVVQIDLAKGSTISSYAQLPLAMGADGYPGIFCANEIDRGRPGTLVGLHEVLDGEPLVMQLGGLDPIEPSPLFRIAATGNSAMASDHTGLYTSVKRQDVSFVDRFILIRVSYLDRKTEESLLERAVPQLPEELRTAMVNVANEIRRAYMGESSSSKALPLTMSTRMLLRWAQMTFAFRNAPADQKKPVFYALERTLLNAADGTDEIQKSIEEIAIGVLGPK